MYLNFSNFRGRTSAGGDKPWSKNGDGKSILQVPDTSTRVLDNTRPFLCSSIVSFQITLACSKERKYHIFWQYWYTINVPVLTNTGTFQYLGPEVYFFHGDKCQMGGAWQNFRRMGGPPSAPPGKKPWLTNILFSLMSSLYLPVFLLRTLGLHLTLWALAGLKRKERALLLLAN